MTAPAADDTLGNNYGIGDTRKKELIGSCKALGINEQRCVAIDHEELQDNPTVWWNTALIETLVNDMVKKWEIDAVSLQSFLSQNRLPGTDFLSNADHHI